MQPIMDDQANRHLLQEGRPENYGSTPEATNQSPINDELTLTPPSVMPMQSSNEGEPRSASPDVQIPSTCTDLACFYKKLKVYVAHVEDSEQWVTSKLIPFLERLSFEVVRISDAIPGKPYLYARTEFIKEASKIIFVISKMSKSDKDFLYDLSKALHKNPDPTEITIIPILFENATHYDVPTQIKELTSIRYSDPNFPTKITKSLYS